MPLPTTATTDNPDACRLDLSNAARVTVQVANGAVLYEVNVAPFGGGENWLPVGGGELRPGYWNFAPEDWQAYGVNVIQGIRFRSKVSTAPGAIAIPHP